VLDLNGDPLAAMLTVICNPSLTRTFCGRSDVAIQDQSFAATTPDWSVTGTFASATTASGTYTVSNGPECNVSGTWSATPDL
jgi:hypothetical protein